MAKYLKYLVILIPVLIISGCTGKEQSTDTTKSLDIVQQEDGKEDREEGRLPDGRKMEEPGEDRESDDYAVPDDGEVIESGYNPGEAVMISNTVAAGYFESVKKDREETRAKNKETLMEIVNNKDIASADKKSAVRQLANITKNAEKENAAELILKAKGFTYAVVSISEGNADAVVAVKENGLTEQQIAQIEDIVKRKTGIEADKMVITPVSAQMNN